MTTDERESEVQRRLRLPYHRVIHGDPDDGYLGEVPELPGCFTSGDAPEPGRGDGRMDRVVPHRR